MTALWLLILALLALLAAMSLGLWISERMDDRRGWRNGDDLAGWPPDDDVRETDNA